MTERWEVVHNTKKGKTANDLQNNNPSKKEKQKQFEKMPKLSADHLRKSGFVTVSDDEEVLIDQRNGYKVGGTLPNKKEKSVASSNLKAPLKNGDATKSSGGVHKSSNGSGDAAKGPPTSLKEALETLSADEIQSQFSRSQASFPGQPQIWLTDITSYLNRQLNPPSCLPASNTTISKIMSGELNILTLLNKTVKKLLRTILDSQKSELDVFTANITQQIVQDTTSKGNAGSIGNKLMLLIVLHDINPKHLLDSFPTLLNNLKYHRSNTPQALRVIWCIEQAMTSPVDAVASFFVAYKAFLDVLLPIVTTNNKQLSGAIVEFAEKLMKNFVHLRNKLPADHIGKQQPRNVKVEDICKVLDIVSGRTASTDVTSAANKQDKASDQCAPLNPATKNKLTKFQNEVVKVLVFDKKVLVNDNLWSQLFDQLMSRLSRKFLPASHEILELLSKCLKEQPELCLTTWCTLSPAGSRLEQTNMILGYFIKNSTMFRSLLLKKNYKKTKSTLNYLKEEHGTAAGRGNIEAAAIVKNTEILLNSMGSSKNRVYGCLSFFYAIFKLLKFLVKLLLVVLIVFTVYELISNKWLFKETRVYKYYTRHILPVCEPYWTSFVTTIYSSPIIKQALDQIQLTYVTYVHPALLVGVNFTWMLLQRAGAWLMETAVYIDHVLQPYYADFSKKHWPGIALYLQQAWEWFYAWTLHCFNVITKWINNFDWSALEAFFRMILNSVRNGSIMAYNYVITHCSALTS